jgi:hypothetical protein
MSKKPSKSKAKRLRAKPPGIPRDPVTGQQFIFDPATGKPTRRYRSRAPSAAEVEAARAARRAAFERDAARRAVFREKRQRHDAAERRYRLPDDVRRFLERLYDEPDLGYYDEPQIARERVQELLREVYVQGCTQGYIEGRVVDLEPRRKRSEAANAAKRRKPREHNGMRYTLDQRDAAIVAEYALLRPMVGATDAQLRLAEKHDLSDKMIRIIVSKARNAAR